MIVAKIIPKNGSPYKGTFDTQEEAEKWVKKHSINRSEQEYEVEYIQQHLDDRESKMKHLRAKRNHILDKTDWLFVSDFRTKTKHRKIYMEYRAYLKDLPKIIGKEGVIGMEEFDHFLRRKYPEEFMDGGDSDIIMKHFYSKLREN